MRAEARDFVPEEEIESCPLPQAIATRILVESERTNIRHQQLMGRPTHETPVTVLESRIVLTAPLIEQVIENPGKSREVYDQMMVFLNIDEAQGIKDRPGSDPKFEELFDTDRMISVMAAELVQRCKPLLDKTFQDTLKTKTEALKLAKERGISASMVYLTDELYEETFRRAHNLDEYANRILEVNNVVTPEILKQSLVNGLLKSIKLPDGLEGADIPYDEVACLFDNPKSTQHFAIMALRLKQPLKEYFYEYLIRFWGQGVIDRLPEKARHVLIDDRPEESRI